MNNIRNIVDFLTELEKLKLVSRKSYVSDFSRRENSAEHSWHLAIGLLTVTRELDLDIDLLKTLRLALVHDISEIDDGDVSVFSPLHSEKEALERRCMERLAGYPALFGAEMSELWNEYEAQQTLESRWVKVLDRCMPFIVNLATEGRAWKEQGVTRSQVLAINEITRQQAPELYAWMRTEIDACVERGWLRDE